MQIFLTVLAMLASVGLVRTAIVCSVRDAQRVGFFAPMFASSVALLLVLSSEVAYAPFAEAMAQAGEASISVLGSIFGKSAAPTQFPAGHDFVFHLPTAQDLAAHVPLAIDPHYQSFDSLQGYTLLTAAALGALAVGSGLVLLMRKNDNATWSWKLLATLRLTAVYFLALHVLMFLAPYLVGTATAAFFVGMLAVLAGCVLVIFGVFARYGGVQAATDMAGITETVRVRIVR